MYELPEKISRAVVWRMSLTEAQTSHHALQWMILLLWGNEYSKIEQTLHETRKNWFCGCLGELLQWRGEPLYQIFLRVPEMLNSIKLFEYGIFL